MPSSKRASAAALTLFLLIVPTAAVAQLTPDQPQPPTPTQPTPPPVPPPARPTPEAPPEPTPPVVAPPVPRPTVVPEETLRAPGGFGEAPIFRGADFFNPPEPRGWMTLTPVITLGGEYNDNLDLVSRGTTSDFIAHIVPGFTLGIRQPNYQLSAGYNLDIDFYAEHSDRNSLAKSQQLYADYVYRFSPGVAFTLNEQFVFDRESNVVSSSGISVGERDSWRNTLTGNLSYQATQRTSLNLSASNTLLRYADTAGTDVHDTTTYRVGVGAGYQFTPRLNGSFDVGGGLLQEETQPDTYNATPSLGFTYQITPTLTGRVSGGPSFTFFKDQTTTSPAGSIGLEQIFRLGSLAIAYDRAITAEAVGVSDVQRVSGLLRLTTIRRELQVDIAPAYSHTTNPRDTGGGNIDTYWVDVRLRYQIARNISLIGSYSYYLQQATRQGDIDQNRVILGVQYAYPINFE